MSLQFKNAFQKMFSMEIVSIMQLYIFWYFVTGEEVLVS